MKERPSPPPPNPFEAAIFASELGSDVPEIDLHGLSVDDIDRELGAFFYRIHPPGTEALKIIHGRGTQKLRNTVHDWLKKHPDIVAYYRDSTIPSQQGGVTLVALQK
jgi:DNA-nicking Smr family endonuclease